MATAEQNYLGKELQARREKLIAAQATQNDASIRALLASVDEALNKMHGGSYGICETCHDPIETDRLLCNPLLRFCLDHLSEAEQRALERDLILAANIQRSLLPPKDWNSRGWLARYHYEPAHVVSGDYFDLIESEQAFLFLLGDVAGKGVAASMLMSHLHATFRALAGQNLPLEELVAHANQLFTDSTTAGQYATLIVGRAWLDGRVEYASAGHLPLLHLSSSNGICSRDATGLPLGMFCGTSFPVCHLKLETGEGLFLYTDGLTETFNAAGDEYGVARVKSLAEKHCAAHPDEFLDKYLLDIRDFSAEKRTDDLTMLVIRRDA